eukprot:9710414-Alexandrium_andersonii.AAC.1
MLRLPRHHRRQLLRPPPRWVRQPPHRMRPLHPSIWLPCRRSSRPSGPKRTTFAFRSVPTRSMFSKQRH